MQFLVTTSAAHFLEKNIFFTENYFLPVVEIIP